MRRGQRVLLVSTAAVLVALASSWLCWGQVRQNPNHVFWDMISNNLSTAGVTHISRQQGQGLDVSQYTHMSFGQHPTAHALTVFKENGNTLATEEISNQQSDFVRYQQITIPSKPKGKKLDTSAVLGQWAQLQTGQTVTGQLSSGLFNQSLLDILPIANLSPHQRNSLLHTMHTQSLFTYDTHLVKKTKLNGHQAYLYAVTIKPEAYVRVMQQFESLLGAKAYAGLQSADFAKSKPLSIVVSVDARSHTLSQLYDVSKQRTERYEGFGIADTVALPKADITTTELTQRLGQLLQP